MATGETQKIIKRHKRQKKRRAKTRRKPTPWPKYHKVEKKARKRQAAKGAWRGAGKYANRRPTPRNERRPPAGPTISAVGFCFRGASRRRPIVRHRRDDGEPPAVCFSEVWRAPGGPEWVACDAPSSGAPISRRPHRRRGDRLSHAAARRGGAPSLSRAGSGAQLNSES